MIYTVFPKEEGEIHRIFRHTRMHKSMEMKNLAEATIRLNQPQESAYRRKE